MQLIAMERGVLPPDSRVPFYAHVDEFQNFSSDVFASLFSEARKFKLHFSIACQFTDQLSATVRAAVIGNAGTLVVFRVGGTDDRMLVSEFRSMETGALADQEPFTAWLKRAAGHNRIFIEPKLYENIGTRDAVIRQSRERFGRDRIAVVRRKEIS
jgi:hypothetical protein